MYLRCERVDSARGAWRYDLATAESVRERLHSDDGRGSRQQWRKGIQRTCGENPATDADRHHCPFDDYPCWNCLSRSSLSRRRDSARACRIREHPVATHRRGRRKGRLLLHRHRVHPDRALFVSKHVIRRFPTALPCHGAERISSV